MLCPILMQCRVVTLSASENDVNMRAKMGNPTYPIYAILNINSGVIVGSTSTGSYAFQTGTGWAPGSILRLINAGRINGKGGKGGDGGSANYPFANNGGAGQSGGPALLASRSISIHNGSGQINGGGGGGGGGGAAIGFVPYDKGGFYIASGGGGGGSGRGTSNTAGGSGGTVSGFASNVNGSAGGTGSDSGAGGGGAGGSQYSAVAGNGGAGGGFGSAGASGANGSGNNYSGTGGSAGAAGVAVNGDSLITWIALGTINGARIG